MSTEPFSLMHLVICISNSMSASGYWPEVETFSLSPGPWFSIMYFSSLIIFHLFVLKDQFSLVHKAGTQGLHTEGPAPPNRLGEGAAR